MQSIGSFDTLLALASCRLICLFERTKHDSASVSNTISTPEPYVPACNPKTVDLPFPNRVIFVTDLFLKMSRFITIGVQAKAGRGAPPVSDSFGLKKWAFRGKTCPNVLNILGTNTFKKSKMRKTHQKLFPL